MRLLMFISWGLLVIFLAVQLAWSVRTETEAKAADLVAARMAASVTHPKGSFTDP